MSEKSINPKPAKRTRAPNYQIIPRAKGTSAQQQAEHGHILTYLHL